MKEHPILFSAPMVRAILDGTKTQTRRVVKHEAPDEADGCQWIDIGGVHVFAWSTNGDDQDIIAGIDQFTCPYGQPGDRLNVRETFYAWGHWTKRRNKAKGREAWHFVDETVGAGKAYRYDADEKLPRRKRELHEVGWWKRPAIFMPRAAVRITLKITGVRVERLQDISPADAIAEGIEREPGTAHWKQYDKSPGGWRYWESPIQSYRTLWESINGPDSWAANPWVWVVEFKRLEGGAP